MRKIIDKILIVVAIISVTMIVVLSIRIRTNLNDADRAMKAAEEVRAIRLSLPPE